MTLRALVIGSLRFYRRTHRGTFLGAAIAVAVLLGALVVGDSLRHALERRGRERLGRVACALDAGERTVRADLADALAADLGTTVAPVLRTAAVASAGEGDGRAGRVQVLGVDPRFWALGDAPDPLAAAPPGTAVVSDTLADALRVGPGEDLVLRFPRAGWLGADQPFARPLGSVAALRLRIVRVVGAGGFGRFDLRIGQVPPLTVFVPREVLAARMESPGKANVLLAGERPDRPLGPEEARDALGRHWTPADAGLGLRELPGGAGLELVSERVFVESPVEKALVEDGKAVPVLTYLVNSVEKGDRRTPYSFVSAPGPPLVPGEVADDEILLNDWLARDLEASPGDRVRLSFFVLGPSRALEERTATFRVRAVVPVAGHAADPGLAPEIPGLSDAANCRDWDPGIPVDTGRIRAQDEAWWQEHRGTPKAFVTLAAAKRLWANPFGAATALRFPPTPVSPALVPAPTPEPGAPATGHVQVPSSPLAPVPPATGPSRVTPPSPAPGPSVTGREQVARLLRERLDPAALGLRFRPVREEGARAAAEAVDFRGLFAGFSFTLLAAALLLTALLFTLGAEERAAETGILRALGFSPGRVAGFRFLEGLGVALAGGLAGLPLGAAYSAVVLWLLGTVWRGATGPVDLGLHLGPGTILAGAVLGVAAAAAALGLAARRQLRLPVRTLLSGAGETVRPAGGSVKRYALPALALFAAVVVTVLLVPPGRDRAAAGVFWAAGGAVLAGGLLLVRGLFDRCAGRGGTVPPGAVRLGVRNVARRPGRSVATVCLLAVGIWVVIAVGANRQGAPADPEARSAGTGGFAFYGETAVPVPFDLENPDTRRRFGLDAGGDDPVRLVPLRVKDGDDASCLNPNRVRQPRLLGVDPGALATRGAFTASRVMPGLPGPFSWRWLDLPLEDGAIPAVADESVIVWGLGRRVGDVLPVTDERGATLRLRLVAGLDGTLFQGSVVVSIRPFAAHFPSVSGARVLLVDAPPAAREKVGESLRFAFRDQGLELTPAAARLAAFHGVENTYLAIFLALGGLGLVLGTAGLGVVLRRGALERRSEFAILRATGFSRSFLRRMLLAEHGLLLALGSLVGTAAAAVSVLPALRQPGVEVPLGFVLTLLAAVVANGALWTVLAAGRATRDPLVPALRNE